ncbi:hypothetical protein PIB30_023890 [Stylosanthes scabra]|uniref:Uncharacterized protein n=1 Tax=Stylosanthes scabra TaxID=79078 RepID=A0ABU6TBQ8_9FABA|nr:hypothetical protein [Stylosanthes scabra]
MSSCIGLLPAPDNYLGSSPSMVHHCRMSWASATQSGHIPSARTCNQVPSARTGGTPKSLQLGLVAKVPLVLSIGMVRILSPASSHKQDKPHRQGNRMINLASQVASPSASILNKRDVTLRLCSALLSLSS